MKKLLKRFAVFFVAAVTACSLVIPASAASLYEWQVYFEQDSNAGWIGNGSTLFSIDRNIHTAGSSYSIRLDNTDYNVSYVEKEFAVDPHTVYRFSAKVKYSGYSLSPEAESNVSGACVGKAYSYDHSEFTTDSDWQTVEFFFNSGDATRWQLCLQNGIYDAKCHGTAWFSEVKLETVELSNNWKVLTIILRNINAKDENGSANDWIMSSISDDDIPKIKKLIKGIATSSKSPNSMYNLSGGLMNIREEDIDFVEVSDPVTSLTPYHYDGDKWGTGEINGNQYSMSSPEAEALIKKLSGSKRYDQIIFVIPLENKTGGWLGIGGLFGDQNRLQLISPSAFTGTGSFPEGALVHEMLHGLEGRSMLTSPDSTNSLHSSSDFGFDTSTDESAREYYSLYMRKALPGNKGIDPSVYMVPTGKYTLVSDDMTVGKGIESKAVGKDISEVSLDYLSATYTGKPLEPDIPLTDSGYALKKGTDYSVTYRNNKDIGTAYADIQGIGAYSGTRTIEFKIVPKLENVNVKLNGNKLTVSWSKVNGASGYDLWQLDGGKFKKLKSGITSISADIPFKKDVAYQFAVSAYIPEINASTEYVYTNEFMISKKPQTVSVTGIGSSLTVEWSEVKGAKYTVMQSTDGKKYKTIAKNTDKLSVQVSVKNGHSYRFKVRAYVPALKYTSGFGYSKTIKIGSVPKVNVKKDVNKITVSWGKLSGAKTYNLWQSMDGAGFTLIKKGISSRSVDLLVQDGHKYQYAVSAYISGSDYQTDFGYSSSVTVNTIFPKVNVKKNGSSFTVSWSNVSGAEYSLWQSVDYGDFVKLTTTKKLSSDVTMKKGHNYRFAVIAFVSECDDYTEYGYSDIVG